MTLRDALLLGRVSNLPTVWTNALTGLYLAGFEPSADLGGLLKPAFVVLAMSAFYTGGMYLNDAFDADVDARERAERPIPSGRVSRRGVFFAAFAMLAAGLALVIGAALLDPVGTVRWAGLGGLALAGAIVFYDWHHKDNPLSPVVMALCRALVYVTAGFCAAAVLSPPVFAAALALLCYVIGLTYAAKQETRGKVSSLWPLLFLAAPVAYGLGQGGVQPVALIAIAGLLAWIIYCVSLIRRGGRHIPAAVGNLIAGIALCDALFLGVAGFLVPALIALGCFVLTLLFQRVVPGT